MHKILAAVTISFMHDMNAISETLRAVEGGYEIPEGRGPTLQELLDAGYVKRVTLLTPKGREALRLCDELEMLCDAEFLRPVVENGKIIRYDVIG